ncbi:MAG: hypothetical protein LIO79_08960 [Rikenellaceae bacterium]|nr:hypothetical protein [Rikenellaceae bacterium]
MDRETLAAIDIGSNAIRLLINYVEKYKDETEFKKAAFVRVPIRLGEDVFTSGNVGKVKSGTLTEAMKAFSSLMKTFNVVDYRACATSAMREAGNGKDLIKNIAKETGIYIEIISGIEEAETIYAGEGLSQVYNKDNSYLYVDVGGGSTEIIVYYDHDIAESHSFPLGTVRIISGAADMNEFKKMKKWLRTVEKKYSPKAIIGSGGNINKAFKLLNKKDRESVSFTELNNLFKKLSALSYDERVEQLRLNIYRADVIIPALKIFTTIGKECGIVEYIIPKVGLSDGIIRQLYAKQMEKNKFNQPLHA